MRSTVVAMLLVVGFLLSALAPAASAAPEDEEIPQIRLVFERDSYSVGELVNYTAYLSANGRPVLADSPGARVAVVSNFSAGGQPDKVWWMVPEEVTKGTWEGNFSVEDEMVSDMVPRGGGIPMLGRVIAVIAMANYTHTRAMAMGLIEVESGPSITVEVDDFLPDPGQAVGITIETKNGTDYVEAHDIVVELMSYDGLAETDLGSLSWARESKGVYKASYTVPVSLSKATNYAVSARASFPDYNHSAYLSPLFQTTFSVRFYDVYLQNISSNDTETKVGVWVADMDGNALSGIDVDAVATVHEGGSSSSESLSATTGADGMAAFTLTHTRADRVDLNASVSDGTYSQRLYLEGMIDRTEPEPQDAEEDGFRVEPWDVSEGVPIFDQMSEPGETITRKFRAYNDSIPLPDKRVNWYMVDRDGWLDTDWDVLESGHAVTDGTGDFEIDFTMPQPQSNAWLMFEARLFDPEEEAGIWTQQSSMSPLIDMGLFPVDDSIEISVDLVEKGDPVELRAKYQLPENSWIGHFMAVVDEDTGMVNWGTATQLGEGGDDFPIIRMPEVGPDTYGYDWKLPEFFPEDQALAFMVLTVNLETFKITVNYEVVDYAESTNKGIDVVDPADPDPINNGTDGSFEVQVTNTGDGEDTYTASQASGPEGWLAFPNETTVIASGETAAVPVTVAVPEDADEDAYYFNVTFTSKDPRVNATVEVKVEVLVNGVFATIANDEATAFRQETVNFIVTLNNTGQFNDTYGISLDGTGAAWATAGQVSVRIPENGESEVVVQVDVPDDALEGDFWVNLTATSSDGVTQDTVTMYVHVLVDGVEVMAGTQSEEAWPTDELDYVFNVTNTGVGSDTYELSLEGGAAGWAALSNDTIEATEGETVDLTVTVTVPSDASEGFYNLTLRATSANGVTNHTATATLRVWVSGVDLTLDESDTSDARGGTSVFTVKVENTGEGDDVYILTYDDDDWTEFVTFDSNPVPVGDGSYVLVNVSVGNPDDIDEGTYVLTVVATSGDGVTMAVITLNVEVVVNGVQANLDEVSIKVKQDKEAKVTLTVNNTGQGEDTYTVLLTGKAGDWATAEPALVTLAEGAEQEVTITVKVPKDADKGDALLNITVLSSDGTTQELAQLQVEVEERDDGPGLGAISAVLAVAVVTALLASSRRREI